MNQDAFELRIRQLQQELGFPGAVAAFEHTLGATGAAATGLADLESGEPLTTEHRMPAASIGKTFAAATAIALAAEDRLQLDARASLWLGEEPWWPRFPNAEVITVRHLLTHSSGLTDHVFSEAWRTESRSRRHLPDSDPGSWFRPHELIQYVLEIDPLFEAGQGYFYTDTGYIVLGLILEAAAGEGYTEQVRKRFLEPLGMHRTEVQRGRVFERLASGYERLGTAKEKASSKVSEAGGMVFNPRTEWTGGGYVSNPQDLARWATALYGGRFLSDHQLDDALSSGYRGSDATANYGLGVFVEDTDFGQLIGHGGWFPGWHSTMYFHRQSGLAVAAQMNWSEPDVRVKVRDSLFEVLLA